MQGKVEICGVNTSKLRILSQKEMDDLLRRCKAGDETARQQLIEGNLRLVLSVIQRFEKRGESPDDLFQAYRNQAHRRHNQCLPFSQVLYHFLP